jgi:O-antigen ligase
MTLFITIATLALIVWLFRRDNREEVDVTSALWIPFFWVFFSGSRFPSDWMQIIGLNLGGNSVDEGSPVDALCFFALIVAGVRVLFRRQVTLAEFFQNNRWVTIYLVYCLIAIVWSDTPLSGFKRWIKLFGQPVMALVVLTEPDPLAAFIRLMKRLAYVILPVSILFTRYYPLLGRKWDQWTFQPMNTGITLNKNVLGCDAFLLGLFFVWYLLQVRLRSPGRERRNELLLCLFILFLDAWVLHTAHSSTSLGAFILGVGILIAIGSEVVARHKIGTYLAVGIVLAVIGEVTFGLHHYLISALGRDSSLTGRTDVWRILLNWDLNPLLGAGFEGFWSEKRMAEFSAQVPGGLAINESHNGYLETYINMGWLGLGITAAMLLATYGKARRSLAMDLNFGWFRFSYLFAFLIYNWTEAAFRTHCAPFFIFFLVAIDYPRAEPMIGDASHHEMNAESSVAPDEISGRSAA